MRGKLERFAWRLWRGEAGLVGALVSILLLPLEGLWRLITRLRNRRYDRSLAERVDGLAVVSVGNLAVGGTGKTPVSAWVAAALADAGHRPAVLLSGYGEDEVALHRAWNPDVPVQAASDRVYAAKAARAEGCDVAVLDDGFQHRRLGRVLDVVLLSAADPVPGPVLPRGPYREPLAALRRADVVVVTRGGSQPAAAESLMKVLRVRGALSEGVTTASARLVAKGAVPLDRWVAGAALSSGEPACDASNGAFALTAVARPDAFRDDVAALTGATTELLAFSDHHSFSRDDVRRARQAAGRRPIFVTEKDAVKLKGHSAGLEDAWVVIQRVSWDWGEEEVRSRLRAVLVDDQEAKA